jgi:ABC-2 type transport system permease protein
VLLLPFALVLLLLFVQGIGFVLSTLMVFFHDIEFLWSVFAMVWMYATPIIYSLSMFNGENSAWLKTAMNFNPLYHYIDFVRTIILEGTSPSFAQMGICLGFSLLSFFLGAFIFKKNQDRFILYL